MLRFEGAVVRFIGRDDILHFEPPAWFERARRRVSIALVSYDVLFNKLKCFWNVGVIVFEAACHDTAKDEVEWLCPSPVFFKIVDFKGTVDRNPKHLSVHGWKGGRKTYLLG